MKTIDQYIAEFGGPEEYDHLTRLPSGDPWPVSEEGIPLCDRCLKESTRYACPNPDSVVFFCDSCDDHAPTE